MNLRNALIVLSALCSTTFTPSVCAQSARDARFSWTLTGGGATIPDAFSKQCGKNGPGNGLGVEFATGVVARPWHLITVQADVRTAPIQAEFGCDLVLYSVDTQYDPTHRQANYTTSTIRIGLETPPDYLLVRATVGVGQVWARSTEPGIMMGVAIGSRGTKRFLLEVERMFARVDAQEVTQVRDSPPLVRPITVNMGWTSFRAGVELPLVRGKSPR